METLQADRTITPAKPRPPPQTRAYGPQTQRSKVTNGNAHFVEGDERSSWARRWRDLLAEILSDIGSGLAEGQRLSEGQRQLARRCATIAIQCEKLEGLAATGESIDIDLYGMMTDRLGRAFQRLGLKRHARDPESLSDYLKRTHQPPTLDNDDIDKEANE